MGKNDYVVIAKAIMALSIPHERYQLAKAMCVVLLKDNSRFNEKRFMAACGLDKVEGTA